MPESSNPKFASAVRERVWICGFQRMMVKDVLLNGAQSVIAHFPQGTNNELKPFARHIQKAVSVDLPDADTASAVCQFLRGRRFPFVLPDGNTVELYVRPDRSIEHRDTRVFLARCGRWFKTI